MHYHFRHKAQGTRHKAQGTRHKAQGTRHKALANLCLKFIK
ncbi:hypothetical protein [Gilliamella sp. Bif1-4]|nr:hypothetical protein [Gilliamella apicola]